MYGTLSEKKIGFREETFFSERLQTDMVETKTPWLFDSSEEETVDIKIPGENTKDNPPPLSYRCDN